MPELPEAEVIKRGLSPLAGQTVVSVSTPTRGPFRTICQDTLGSLLTGRRLERVERRGKWLLFVFERGARVLFLLGMSGKLLLGEDFSRHENYHRLVVTFSGGKKLFYNDIRGLGSVVFDEGEIEKRLRGLGLDPLSRGLTGEYLAEKARGKTRRLKDFIKDQRIIAGVGNIYANEALFAARLNPLAPAGSVSEEGWRLFARCLREILATAVDLGGTSLGETWSNYCDALGRKGRFAGELKIYKKTGCPECGREIQKVRRGKSDQSTFYCPGCQEA